MNQHTPVGAQMMIYDDLKNMDFAVAEQRVMAHFMTLKKINGVDMMSHLQIAEVVNSRPDNVKRAVERLEARGVITFTPMEEKSTGGRPGLTFYVNERDSYVVVAQLYPEFTAKLVDFWMAYRQPQVPQTLSAALRLAADQQEQIEHQQKVISEQQRVKAHITEGREGTLFSKVGTLTKENTRLKDAVGEGKNWKLLIAIPWLGEFFDVETPKHDRKKGHFIKGMWSAVGRAITKLAEVGEVRKVDSSEYPNGINQYHVDLIQRFYDKLISDPGYLEYWREDV